MSDSGTASRSSSLPATFSAAASRKKRGMVTLSQMFASTASKMRFFATFLFTVKSDWSVGESSAMSIFLEWGERQARDGATIDGGRQCQSDAAERLVGS